MRYDELKAQIDAAAATLEEAKQAMYKAGYASVTDGGSPSYLDGIEMQYSVGVPDADGVNTEWLAYFEHGDDAQLFVDAYNARRDAKQAPVLPGSPRTRRTRNV